MSIISKPYYNVGNEDSSGKGYTKSPLPDDKLRDFLFVFGGCLTASILPTAKMHQQEKVYCRFLHNIDC